MTSKDIIREIEKIEYLPKNPTISMLRKGLDRYPRKTLNVTINVPIVLLEILDLAVKIGIEINRSSLVRNAIIEYLMDKKELLELGKNIKLLSEIQGDVD